MRPGEEDLPADVLPVLEAWENGQKHRPPSEWWFSLSGDEVERALFFVDNEWRESPQDIRRCSGRLAYLAVPPELIP